MSEATQPRVFQGVWIERRIWESKELTLQEKVMLVEIRSLQDPVRGCYASNRYFADFFDLSVSRISEIISSLAKKGFVQVNQIRDGKQCVERRVFLVKLPDDRMLTPSENSANPFGKVVEPPSGKAKGSNTVFNNTDDVNHGRDESRDKPVKQRAAKRKTQMPDGFQPGETHIAKAKQHGINLTHEFEQFCNYHASKASTFADWDRALHAWLGNAVKFSRGGNRSGRPAMKTSFENADYRGYDDTQPDWLGGGQ